MSKLPPAQKRLHDLQQALSLHKAGRLDEAAEIYKAVLRKDARDFDANLYLGMVLVQQQDYEPAIFRLQTAAKVNAQSALAQVNLGVALAGCERHSDAVTAFETALRLKPDFADAQARLANAYYRSGRLDDALAAYDRLLATRPDPALLNDKGCVLRDLKQYDAAATALRQALALVPEYTQAQINLGHVLFDAQDFSAAADAYKDALARDPGNKDALAGYIKALKAASRDEELEAAITRVVASGQASGLLMLDLGHLLRKKKKFAEAIDAYAKAAELDGDNPEIFFYWGLLLYDLGRYDGAAEAYGHMIRLKPDAGAAYQGRAEALRRIGRVEEALADYARAVELLPDDLSLAISALHAQMKVCDWRAYPKAAALIARLRSDEKAVLLPFPLVALPASAKDQMICAERYVAHRFNTQKEAWDKPDYGHAKIRVAYVSADFHKHATLVLMAGMFEAHDKERFEVIAVSLGRDDGSELRKRVVGAVDEFVDAYAMSDEQIIQLLRERECDIIVDLKGFTMDGRATLFFGRHAPVQVAYIGYPGTCALPNIDYFIGDTVTITPEIEQCFTERIVYLPHSYQVNDDKRFYPAEPPSRSSQGLPDDAFVFCSFNNNYKFTPDVFAVWMNILRRVDNSVLWLLQDNQMMMDNLRAAATAQGIDAARLIFAPKAALDDHIARLPCADLFLDSLPCNAHTTASDALWAGLPVLTCPGDTFAGRVAASLLAAVNMPELIAPDLGAYEELAVTLAQDKAKYAALRTRLADNRTSAPLFDTARSTRAIERSYEEMMQRFRAGLAPDHIKVSDV